MRIESDELATKVPAVSDFVALMEECIVDPLLIDEYIQEHELNIPQSVEDLWANYPKFAEEIEEKLEEFDNDQNGLEHFRKSVSTYRQMRSEITDYFGERLNKSLKVKIDYEGDEEVYFEIGLDSL